MSSPFMRIAALLPLVVLVACAKGPAQEALKAADAAVQAAESDAGKFVPDKFKELQATAKSAHEKFDKGDYSGALAEAKGIAAKAQEIAAAAAAKKTELTTNWDTLNITLPPLLDQLKARLQAVTAGRTPPGLDKATIEEVQRGYDSVSQIWSEAGATAAQGDLLAAVTRASEIQSRVGQMMNKLGLETTPAAMSPTRNY